MKLNKFLFICLIILFEVSYQSITDCPNLNSCQASWIKNGYFATPLGSEWYCDVAPTISDGIMALNATSNCNQSYVTFF